MSNTDTTSIKRKHPYEDGSKSAKRQRQQEHKRSQLSAPDRTAIKGSVKTQSDKVLPFESKHQKAIPKEQKKQATVAKAIPATPGTHAVSKPTWALNSRKGGRYADRDPIVLGDAIVTAVGDEIKVLNITNSSVVATLAAPPDTRIVSFDAISTPQENLIRILYSNEVLIDWDWTTNSKDESKLAVTNVDLYRLAPKPDDRTASIYTTWDNKSCAILLDGIELHSTVHRVVDLRVLSGVSVIAALCERAVLIGRKESTDEYTWVELPWSKRATCFDIRERRGSKTKDFSLVVGLEGGMIELHNNVSSLFTKAELHTPQQLHWHRNTVAAVKFSPDGNYIISGGSETVLVMWQLATGHKSFLPNLTSPIERIAVNAAGNRYNLRLGDNSIMVLSTTELKPVANFAGLQMSTTQRCTAILHPKQPDRLLLSAAESQRARSRAFLQTYDMGSDKHVSRQALTRNNVTDLKDSPEHMPILPPDVERLAVSNDGSWLATLDTWTPPHRDLVYLATDELMTDEDKAVRTEVHLKIWRWNALSNEWMLNSRMDQPHSHGFVPAKVFKILSDTTKPGFVTVGEDSAVRIWRPRRKTRAGLVSETDEEIEWVCRNTIELEKAEDRTDLEHEGDSPVNAALSISDDGSLLAVCVLNEEQQVIHLIDMDTGEVRSSHDNIAAPELIDIAFIDRYLVALSRRTLRVWDVVADRLHYTVRVPVSMASLLAVSRQDNAFAVASPAVALVPGAITIYGVQPAEQQCRVKVGQAVSAILSHPAERGFKVIFEDASTATLSSTSSLSPAQQLALTQTPALEVVSAAMTTSVKQLVEPQTAIVSTLVESQAEDDRSVVRPEQLAKIFDVGTNAAALPSVREMFHAVAGLFGRKPKLI
ncbi:hypothetical protein AMS68_000922 [Peltaster fructicola]|uniref:WD repeat-containing protein 75 second beta-propeller domain-containing protein n=1 Tax=Peltaster fructicola TaxID=286661 RepID=A0A6H0XLA4_9PEZI|nr:hypothetical protein AMS68_000922 [Peltaster fructicola]